MPDLVYLDVIEKYPGEEYNETFEFSGIVNESKTVVSATVTATKSDGTDVTSDMIGEVSVSSTTVTVPIKTLSAEASYIIRVNVIASDTFKYSRSKLLHVAAPGAYL